MTSPASRKFVLKILLLGLIAGTIGFFINLRPLTLGGGLDFLFGGTVAFIMLRTCNWRSGLITIVIAAAATILLWHHPWAMLIWIAEYIFIARPPVFRKSSSIFHSLIFWLFLGLPLVLVSYGWWMTMPLADAFLVAQKQALNGLVNLAIANAIVVGLTWLLAYSSKKSSGLGFSWRPLSMQEQVISVLVLFVILPLLLELHFRSARLYSDVYKNVVEQLDNSTSLVEGRFAAWSARQQYLIDQADHYWREENHKANAVHLIRHLVEDPNTAPSILCLVPGGSGSPIVIFPPNLEAEDCPDSDRVALEVGGMAISWRPAAFDDKAGGIFHLYGTPDDSPNRNLWVAAFPEAYLHRELLPKQRLADDIDLLFESRQMLPATDQVYFSLADAEILEPLQSVSNFGRLGRTLVTPTRLGTTVMLTVGASSFQRTITLPFADAWSATVSIKPETQLAKIRHLQSSALSRFVMFVMVAILLAVLIGRASSTVLSDLVSAVPFNLAKRTIDRPISSRIFLEGGELYDRLERAQRRFAEENAENARLRSILVEISRLPPLGIYSLSLGSAREDDVRITFLSPSIQNLLGGETVYGDYSKALLLWRDLIHPEDRKRVEGRLRKLSPGSRDIEEYRIKSLEDNYRWVVDCAIVSSQEESFGGGHQIIGTIIDVTDLKLAQQSIVQLSKLSTLGEMAAGLAHEINQPLQAITFAISNLEADLATFPKMPKSQAVARRLSIINEQIDRASSIIANVALFGRSNRLELGALDSVELAESIRNLASPICRERSIVFEVKEPVVSQFVLANKVSAEQVLLNFVTNACDAIEERIAGGDRSPGRIEFAVLDQGDRVSFRISDNGTGLPEGSAESLFEPFFTTKPAGKGTGLGLSVAFGISQEMGGSIHACNLHKGAAFTLDLSKSAQDAFPASLLV